MSDSSSCLVYSFSIFAAKSDVLFVENTDVDKVMPEIDAIKKSEVTFRITVK